MATIIETKIDRFDGGIATDPRDERTNVARFISNGDVFTNPKRIIPYRQSEVGDTLASTERKQAFAIARRTGTTYSLFGLGVEPSDARGHVKYMDISNLDGATWTDGAGSTSVLYNVKFDCFVYYQRVNRIFGFAHFENPEGTVIGIRIFSYDPTASSGAGAWDDNPSGLTSGTSALGDIDTVVAQGLVHSKDDILYLPYDNIIVRNNSGSWTAVALTLPTNIRIASICEYGDYVAILGVDRSGVGNSRVFIWDRNETTLILSESFDAGTGSGMIIEFVDGELIVISQKGGASATLASGAFPKGDTALQIPQNSVTGRDKVIFRRLIGNRFVKVFEIIADRTGGFGSTSIRRHKQLVDSRLFFQMIIRYNGSVRDGLWSFGRSALDQPFTLVHEQPSNNNTALTTGDAMRGFIVVGDFIFQSFGSGGSGATYNTRKTIEISDTSFSANTIIETKHYDGSHKGFDAAFYKDLEEVSVMTDAQVSGGSIQLDYQTNVDVDTGSSTWTTIFTNTTTNSLSHTANNIESTGAVLPRSYKSISFRIIATVGAIIQGLRFKEKVHDKRFISD